MKKFDGLGRSLSTMEQKNVLGGVADGGGGGGLCRVRISGGSNAGYYSVTVPGNTCGQQSASANQFCLGMMDGGSCHYDCQCDGWGQ